MREGNSQKSASCKNHSCAAPDNLCRHYKPPIEADRCTGNMDMEAHAPGPLMDSQENEPLGLKKVGVEERLSIMCIKNVLGFFGHIMRREEPGETGYQRKSWGEKEEKSIVSKME